MKHVAKIGRRRNSSENVRLHSRLSYFKRNWVLYCFILPGIIHLILFSYLPLFGVQIGFRDYHQAQGFFNSPWVGLKHFRRFVNAPRFWSIIKNTITISATSMLFTFPLPIFFALLLNQTSNLHFKKLVQDITYIPHFISLVVVIGMTKLILSPSSGIINAVIKSFGGKPINFMAESEWFLPIYIITTLWSNTGWSAIIYIAALTSVPPDLHEAAILDGASKMKRIIHIDLPCILPTVVIQLIMSVSGIMNVGFEKVFLMQNPLTLETTEVISTYVYKMGIANHQYSFSTAVNLFNAVISLILVLVCNKICKKLADISLF